MKFNRRSPGNYRWFAPSGREWTISRGSINGWEVDCSDRSALVEHPAALVYARPCSTLRGAKALAALLEMRKAGDE